MYNILTFAIFAFKSASTAFKWSFSLFSEELGIFLLRFLNSIESLHSSLILGTGSNEINKQIKSLLIK